MLCNKCLEILASDLSKEAKRIFNIITDHENGITRSEVQEEWKNRSGEELTYAIATSRLNELENKMFITHQMFSQTKVYGLTEHGYGLLEMIKRRNK